MKQEDYVKSVIKAFKLLDCIYEQKEPVRLEELIKMTGFKKATCHRLLQTLLSENLIVKKAGTKLYTLGPKLITLGLSALDRFDLHREALPLMNGLRDITGESVNLSILDGHEILTIERIRSVHLYNMSIGVGSRLPIYCTSQGKAVLSFLSQEKQKEILQKIDLTPMTHKTIRSKTVLRKELAKIRAQGYAVNREEFEVGIGAVAAPILSHSGEAVASLNISFALARHPEPEFISLLVEKVVDSCRQLSFFLGYVEP